MTQPDSSTLQRCSLFVSYGISSFRIPVTYLGKGFRMQWTDRIGRCIKLERHGNDAAVARRLEHERCRDRPRGRRVGAEIDLSNHLEAVDGHRLDGADRLHEFALDHGRVWRRHVRRRWSGQGKNKRGQQFGVHDARIGKK